MTFADNYKFLLAGKGNEVDGRIRLSWQQRWK
jgi:hypothetical protein